MDPHRLIAPAQVAADAHHRSPGAHARDERVGADPELLELRLDLGAGGVLVRLDVHRVVELAREEHVIVPFRELLRQRDRADAEDDDRHAGIGV